MHNHPAQPDLPPAAAKLPQVRDNNHELVLVKDGHRYVFRCAPGQERKLMDQLAEMVRDPQSQLSWFDAAVLSHQLGRRMSRRLTTLNQT